MAVNERERGLRKPGAKQRRGLNSILLEMDTIVADMRTYRDADEKRRAADIVAGLEWIDAAIKLSEGKK
jgi:hypothetical protein